MDLVISGTASTPDRTSYILNSKEPDSRDVLIRDLGKLIGFGAKAIAIPCNTAHFFYDDLVRASPVPIFNMIEDTVKLLQLMEVESVGILATKGTIESKLYQRALKRCSVEYIIPGENRQAHVSRIIYEQVKGGKKVDMNLFNEVVGELAARGCKPIY